METMAAAKPNGRAIITDSYKLLSVFYRANLLEEEEILKWAPRKCKSETSKLVHESAKPFIDWLSKPASEEEDGDEEDDDA